MQFLSARMEYCHVVRQSQTQQALQVEDWLGQGTVSTLVDISPLSFFLFLVATFFVVTGDTRNDIYVSLLSGDFKGKDNKKAEKNMECVVSVILNDGSTLKVSDLMWLCA